MNDRDVRSLLQAIDASPSRVASLLTTPLMLTLVAVVYRAEQAIPPELPAFFEMLFSTLFSRHDRTKSGFIRKRYSPLTERETQTLFEAFCFMTRHHRLSTSLADAEFNRAFRDATRYSGISCDETAFYQDITKIACLMQREGVKTNFVHKSIQEFFAASFVRRANDAFATRYYATQRQLPVAWRQENAFLMQIDPYRFGRNFFLPEIRAIEAYCGLSFTDGIPVADERVLELLVGDNILEVTSDDFLDTQVNFHVPSRAGPLLNRLIMRTAWPCYDYIDGAEEDDKEEILDMLEESGEDHYTGRMWDFIQQADLLRELKENIDAELALLKQRYDYLSNIIELEESKAALFDGIDTAITPP